MRSSKGSIVTIERGKLYRVFVSSGYDPVTGKRVRPSVIVRGSRRKAEEKLVEMLLRSGNGSTVRGSLTVDSFWRCFYLPDAEARLRASTVQGYRNHYEVHIRQQLGGMRLSQITPLVISNWLAGIDGQARKFEAYKMLRMVVKSAYRLDVIESNPFDKAKPPRKPTDYEPEVLDAEDVQVYMWHFAGTRAETAVLVALGAGLRRSEVIALDWRDILPDGTVVVDNAVTSIGGRQNDDDPKSRFSKRRVHLPRSVFLRLEELRQNPRSPLVQDTNGNRMNPDNLTKEYTRLLRLLPEGVPRVPFKNLRHTSLTLAVESGVDILAVSRRAGHSSVDITARYYLRPHDSVDADAARRLENALS